MKKNITKFLSLITLVGLVIGFSSCDKDEEPPPVIPNLSFAEPNLTVNEADGTIEVEVRLDNPALEDMIVEYSLTGTAKDKAAVAVDAAFDYEILSEAGEIEIKKGDTTGAMEIKLYSDLGIEQPETIEIKIENVDSENVEITREDDLEVTIEQEDGLVIALNWPAPDAGAQADMDILLRVGANITTWDGILTGSADGSFEAPEAIFLPKTLEYAAYGVSYVYYDGTLDPLEFTATFVEFIDGDFEPDGQEETFTGTYTAVNKNKWTDANTSKVVQTFLKSGTGFSDISQITVAPTGSRVRPSGNLPMTLKKEINRNFSSETKSLLIQRLDK